MKIQKVNGGVCRIASLRGFKGVLYGRDLAGVFENGHVYSVVKVLGEIVVTDLGKHAAPEYLTNKKGLITGTISQLAVSGVPVLTEKEYEIELKNEE